MLEFPALRDLLRAYTQVAILTEKARDAIVAIDPYRKGFDVFKSELIAAEKAASIPQDQAAE